jgi:arylformamidase
MKERKVNPFGRLTAGEMEGQYNLRSLRPDYEAVVVPDWLKRSEHARSTLRSRFDIPYGSSDRQKLDVFFGPSADGPTLVYFHGGYWQRGDRSIYSFLAEPFVHHGVTVIVPGYDLCPNVSITEISRQARNALAWIWRNARGLGVGRDRLSVMGHSAGGHITGMMMGTKWSALAGDLPDDLIKAGVPISPLNLLEPLRYTSIGDALRMTEEEAARESPMNNPPATDAPQLVVCGGGETEEFHRQADMYVEAFATRERSLERYSVPDCDHFDELNALADDKHAFFQKALALMNRS